MVEFNKSLNASLKRYISSLEAIGYQKDSEIYKLLCALFILHCLSNEGIYHNLTKKQLNILSSLIECLYKNSCIFRKTDMICETSSNIIINI